MPPAFSQQRRLIAATIRFFDLFSGIGGFREGLRRAGGFTCVGHCEVDAYADKNYRLLFDTEGEWFCNDARTIETERMPDFDLLCAGFPCQAFSIAGKREGFADASRPWLAKVWRSGVCPPCASVLFWRGIVCRTFWKWAARNHCEKPVGERRRPEVLVVVWI